MTFAAWIAIMTVLDTLSIVMARFYVEKDKKHQWHLWASLALFASAGYVYVQMLEFAVTAIVNIIYLGFSTMLLTVTCYYLFKEKVTWGQGAGIVVIIAGLALL